MINFYRKLRRQLISDSTGDKTEKKTSLPSLPISIYIKYAIGEIALVVIGILIALQINNWNGQRKIERQQVHILMQLKIDLLDNLEEMNGIQKGVTHRNNSIDSILSYFKNKKAVDKKLLRYFFIIKTRNLFNSTNATYTFIENGGINFLSNDELRLAVTEMYERNIRNIHLRSEVEKNIIQDELEPFMMKHFGPAKIINGRLEEIIAPMVKPLNLVELRENIEFQNILYNLSNKTDSRIILLEASLQELENLIQKVQLEIDTLND